ncbi:hypothetical protein J7432_21625 [Xanthomonas axonopodis pv. begoniae]|nr:hypothetical protein [Xanthomonas axonopodis pv. begoniae]MBO9773832.1 hypothetical protein [Xanthomonas axonopodis pv. begoniae]
MADYRNKLTLIGSSGSRVMVLQCNKSERKSFVKHYQDDGNTGWAKETVVGWHPDKTPKILHVAVQSEQVYEIFGQPKISGLYALYSDSKGQVWYCSISQEERAVLKEAKKKGKTFRDALLELGKNVF